jgi:hypothetical protein
VSRQEIDPDDENAANEFAADEHKPAASSSSRHDGDLSHTLSATNLKSDKYNVSKQKDDPVV